MKYNEHQVVHVEYQDMYAIGSYVPTRYISKVKACFYVTGGLCYVDSMQHRYRSISASHCVAIQIETATQYKPLRHIVNQPPRLQWTTRRECKTMFLTLNFCFISQEPSVL